ncbi:8456_t:CDS:1, partial [Scutellospora calospora]
KLMIELTKNNIVANITKTYLKQNGKKIRIGDGGIDIFGRYKGMHFIMQAKFRTDKESYVVPKDVKEFIAVLMEQPKNTIGIFVSNAKFSARIQTYASNSKEKVILCNEDNLIEKIKEAHKLYSNSDIDDIVSLEDITTGENTNTEIFGIKFEGSIKIGKLIRRRITPY